MEQAIKLARIIVSLFEEEQDDFDGEALILETYYLAKEILNDGHDQGPAGPTGSNAQ